MIQNEFPDIDSIFPVSRLDITALASAAASRTAATRAARRRRPSSGTG